MPCEMNACVTRGGKTLKSHKDMYITTSQTRRCHSWQRGLILPQQRRAATASLEPRHKTCGMSLPLGSDADTLCLYVSVMIIAFKISEHLSAPPVRCITAVGATMCDSRGGHFYRQRMKSDPLSQNGNAQPSKLVLETSAGLATA